MREEGVKKLPVVADGDLVGVVTTTDLAHFLPRYRTEVEWQGEPLVEDG
jgi:CBS-domain-containing membrane protein